MSLQVLKSFKTVTEEKENSQSIFLPDKLLHCCDQRGKQTGIAATDAAKARAFKNKVLLILSKANPPIAQPSPQLMPRYIAAGYGDLLLSVLRDFAC